MKKILIPALLGALLFTSSPIFAQEVPTKDSLKSAAATEKPAVKKKAITYPRPYGGVTFSRIDWGFSRILDNGSFTLGEESSFLSYSKASNFGFDVMQFGVRFSDNFKVYLSSGFEWNYFRLEKNILLNKGETPLAYQEIDPEELRYSKNILTSTYLRLPLTFELRSNQNERNKRYKLAFGLFNGVLLKGTQRVKSKEGKSKYKDNFNLQSFQYGPFVRVGYEHFGIYAKYYVNDIFEKSPDQKGLHNLTFGLSLGF
ncbi:MAG TPA: PorT family protein [Candidatus Sphingobacterium stercoripullorum]|uniref:PorT family protein n=1 Tax=Candidatus Sphingobacterium stercoripullorum TaxID=2838759 RepID=A0A9D1W6P3_9SPHI|nr:PorT family protein [Candidatus Sphingobacterium stercoripullorum]